MKFHKVITLLISVLIGLSSYSQENESWSLTGKSNMKSWNLSFADSLEKKPVTKKTINAIFLGLGGGLSIPLGKFKDYSKATFGILGRVEFASTSIFPFVIGAQVDYFSFDAPDDFKSVNSLTTYKTKVLAFGLNIDYSLSKLIRSSFTMPYLTAIVKGNFAEREYDEGRSLAGLTRKQTLLSVGAGLGMTLFIFDFFAVYNYIKDNSFIGVYTKTKFPIIRF